MTDQANTQARTSDEDPAAVLYVRLYCKALDDTALMELSFSAVGVWVVGLLIAKRTVTDGVIPPSQLRRDAALRQRIGENDLEAAIEELIESGLWVVDDVGSFRVVSWIRYNTPTEVLGVRRRDRKDSSDRANHTRWHINKKQPKADCKLCIEEGLVTPHVSESESGGDPDRTPGGSLEVEVEVEVEVEKEGQIETPRCVSTVPPREPATTVRHTPTEGDITRLAMQTLGYPDPTPTAGQIKTVQRAITNGWTTTQLLAQAEHAATKAEPLSYWESCIRKASNIEPPPDAPAAPSSNGNGPAPWKQAWRTVAEAVQRNGANSFLVDLEHGDQATYHAAQAARQIIRYEDAKSGMFAFKDAYESANT